MWLVTIIFWLQAFMCPVIVFGVIALAVTSSGTVAIVLVSIGGVVGIVLAEYIRRKIGLSTFFARIYGKGED